MANPKVTITLGRSGQRVVKGSSREFDGSTGSGSAPSGSKRSLAESFGSSAGYAFDDKKRMRDDGSARSFGYSCRTDDSRLGPKDLRLRLTRQRISKEIELENEERKKMELREKVSRTIRSLESPDDKLLRSLPSVMGAPETPKMGSMRSSDASWTSKGEGTRLPERVLRSSSGISTPRGAVDELLQVPPVRPISASRMTNSPLDSSRPKFPVPTVPRRPLDSGKLVTEFPPVAGGMSIPSFQSSHVPKESQPLTVSSLLHSLGLGKYYINFQAEEIDMAVLKQMGETDLKELGIPMGPRKKILLALQARAKRPVTQVQSNHLL